MATNLAQARRNYYGGNTNNGAAGMDSGTLYYNADGSKTGARIDGRVKRKTMMGGRSQGPISSRPNRSEAMEQEAETQMEAARQKGEARARAQAQTANGSRPGNGYDVPVGGAGKPAGYWRAGRSAGSQVYEKGTPSEATNTSAQDTTIGQRAMMTARRIYGAQSNFKAKQDRNFSRQRVAMERNPEQYPPSTVKRMSTGMADMREEARRRGDLNKY